MSAWYEGNLSERLRRYSTSPRPFSSAGRHAPHLLAATLLTFASLMVGSARADDGEREDRSVRVMTQNMDEGTDFLELIAARSLPEFLAAVTVTYQNILATKPTERATAMAREIAREKPDLVGLQEASILRTGNTAPATIVKMDLLESLLSELTKLGEHYAVVAIVPGLDAEAPSTLGFDVRVTTQDAIIARTDIDLLTIQIQVEHFKTTLTIPTVIGPITIPRGWASIDAIIRGRALRFVTTHLEPNSPAVQLAQATELVQIAGHTTLPVVFAGDFNATANDPLNPTFATYQALIKAGFVDVWKRERPGFTCCQNPNLLNSKSTLNQRIDLILLSDAFGTGDVNLVGNKQADRTPLGLWPSDHAGVAATLRVARQNQRMTED
jgi:endonuclease/exonuclease/phosphatase family metal-dependent hydrolase